MAKFTASKKIAIICSWELISFEFLFIPFPLSYLLSLNKKIKGKWHKKHLEIRHFVIKYLFSKISKLYTLEYGLYRLQSDKYVWN